jgi:carboxylate-amine ligase
MDQHAPHLADGYSGPVPDHRPGSSAIDNHRFEHRENAAGRTMPCMVPTVGVEEEFVLLDPVTGEPVAAADRMLSSVTEVAASDQLSCDFEPEMLRAQLEAASPVCRDLQELSQALTTARRRLHNAAERTGALLAATGTAPLKAPGAIEVTDHPRYRQLYCGNRGLVQEQLLNGMHVHVAVPSRSAGVSVLNRLRPWLHIILALAANSPVWDGRDTGFASWRTVHAQRWAVHGPPPGFADAAAYERHVDWLTRSQVILDRGQLYWTARLSERYPTVEIRVPDVQLTTQSSIMVAGLVRALVTGALADLADGRPEPQIRPDVVSYAFWDAARHGLTADLLDLRDDPVSPRRRSITDLVDRLIDSFSPFPALRCDLAAVLPQVSATLSGGCGAQQQSQALSTAGLPGLLALLADASASSPPNRRPGDVDAHGESRPHSLPSHTELRSQRPSALPEPSPVPRTFDRPGTEQAPV